ncbi:hypothetical protein ACJRO7_013064 [Eucalyptus globulus]|uniref:Uncharacterized protein n=1 Tax=Eucalyptus globulus TaxID=34317 RepID=A0ABD3LPY5_EUCGL
MADTSVVATFLVGPPCPPPPEHFSNTEARGLPQMPSTAEHFSLTSNHPHRRPKEAWDCVHASVVVRGGRLVAVQPSEGPLQDPVQQSVAPSCFMLINMDTGCPNVSS